ncbi:hypothetical protein [Jatrophihabitans endophyticus]|uniref:hypothetical protein n=1 Tax=Jatrophihabitans endophyticus TaxID=1206085 RepID=UPI0019F358C6|nr:hypothetical protein [Jatrophihabitans endophyticus]MBE7186808.1 hypothetical protein [Jatrophihabitans endophyticus]
MSDQERARPFSMLNAPKRTPVPWFEPVLAAMADAPTRYAGVVEAFVEDDGGTRFRYRVTRDGDRVRCVGMDGGVHVVANLQTEWCRGANDREVRTQGRDPRLLHVPDDYEFGVRSEQSDRWEGNDFTEPIGGPEEGAMLGRPAWRITLAPPPHKPAPMYIVVDRETSLTLGEGNDTFGTYHHWVELDLDPSIDDDAFRWRDGDRPGTSYV